ncbi:hypothetical protein F4808DRAFT_8412 [Astrocystis sublimbata]|nr:hypothetical protein F4808DRAFT_8412 [Astrocystis sublimbata]
MAYDRDAIAARITKYYKLLEEMAYLDPADIQYPPPEGWNDDQLAVDILRALNRSDKVIDLLRHLPYIGRERNKPEWEIYPETRPISYLRDSWLLKNQTAESCADKGLHRLAIMPDDVDWPSGMISLTFGRESTFWIIDTDAEQLFPVGVFVIDDTAPESEPWRRNGKAHDILEYLDSVHSSVYNLTLIPAPRSGIWDPRIVHSLEPPEGVLVGRLLREHGWPDNFKKGEYLQAVQVLRTQAISESL